MNKRKLGIINIHSHVGKWFAKSSVYENQTLDNLIKGPHIEMNIEL